MRFPFGRGARQREIDGLRQRIAELQDEITRIDESLGAESPDVETTDAYRSVQVLRESMRREEIAALREEMRGLEARLETLTVDRRASKAAANEPPPSTADSEAVGVIGDALQAEAADSSSAGPAEGAGETPLGPARAAVTGHGLPSERAIIEPPLPSEPSAPVGPALVGEEGAAAATDQEPVLAAEAKDAQSIAAPAEAERAVAETPTVVKEEPTESAVPVEATTTSAAEVEVPAEVVSAEDEEPAAFPGGAEPVEEPQAAPGEAEPVQEPAMVSSEVASDDEAAAIAAEREAGDLVAATEGAEPSADDEAEAVVEGEGERAEAAAEATEALPARRPSRATVVLIFLVSVAILAIVAVAALETGLINTGIAPPAVPTALPTRQPPTSAPATARPTTAPSPIPSPTPLIGAAPSEESLLEGARDLAAIRLRAS